MNCFEQFQSRTNIFYEMCVILLVDRHGEISIKYLLLWTHFGINVKEGSAWIIESNFKVEKLKNRKSSLSFVDI